jgi:hypothetical protein
MHLFTTRASGDGTASDGEDRFPVDISASINPRA